MKSEPAWDFKIIVRPTRQQLESANSRLLEAVERNNLHDVTDSIKKGANINNNLKWYRSKKYHVNDICNNMHEDTTILGVAAALGHSEIVHFLIEEGANPLLPCSRPAATPRKLAKRGDLVSYLNTQTKMSKYLDEPNSETGGLTPLGYCLKTCETYHGVNELIALGADVCKLDVHHKTPLMYAIDKDQLKLVQLVLSNGAEVTLYSGFNYALDRKNYQVVEYLIKTYSSLINCVLPDGFTPLTKTLKFCSEAIARLLIENGANPNEMDKHNSLPLNQALEMNSLEIVSALLKKGASVNYVFPDGYTPLTKALKVWNGEIVKYLLENGADPNQTDKNNVLPVDLALGMSSFDLIELLVDKGATVPRKLKGEDLQKIVEKSNLNIYRFLLKNNWDIDQMYDDGKTLLAHFASQGNLRLVVFFIENRADVASAGVELQELKEKNEDFNFYMKRLRKINDHTDGAQE